jgi:hypothetical protein
MIKVTLQVELELEDIDRLGYVFLPEEVADEVTDALSNAWIFNERESCQVLVIGCEYPDNENNLS